MENINQLLNKYFEGKTTLAEEKELKIYFSSPFIAKEHIIYQSLFQTFDEELKEIMCLETNKTLKKKQNQLLNWKYYVAYSGIAASLVLALWSVKPFNRTENYAVLNGKRIEDTDFSEKYVNEKFSEVNSILKNSMKPLQKMDLIRESLQPLHKFSETKEKVNKYRYKLQLK